MIGRLALAAGLAAAAAAFAIAPVSAAPQSKLPGLTGGSLVEPAQWSRCRRWRLECADRHGWRSPGYYRCLRRHDCD